LDMDPMTFSTYMTSPGARKIRSPIFIMSFNRPDYLSQVLKSLVEQVPADINNRKVVLFQDGAVNLVSQKRRARDEDILACIDVFRTAFPDGEIQASSVNLGVALNFDRAEQYGTKY